MSLSDRFWSMSPSEIQRVAKMMIKFAGKITYDEKMRIHLLLENRFCMTELKAGFDSVFVSGHVSLLKQAVRVSYSAALQEHADIYGHESSGNVDPKKRKVSLSGNRQMEHLIRKGSIMDSHRERVQKKTGARLSPVPGHFQRLQQLDSAGAGGISAIERIGLNDQRFDLRHKTVKNQTGHKVVLPVLSHKRHNKQQYLALCKAADLFYSGDGSNAGVHFDEDVLQKLLHVVDMLQKHKFLSSSLAEKAKEFVMKGDKYIVYALYKYDTNFDSLEAYLRYKMTDDERMQREVAMAQKALKRRNR